MIFQKIMQKKWNEKNGGKKEAEFNTHAKKAENNFLKQHAKKQKWKKGTIINIKLILQRWTDAYSATSSVFQSGDAT